MSGEMTGQTVLITGGNTGIGRVTALQLAQLGAEVVIVARNKDTCETTVEHIKSLTKNEKVSYHIVDLGSSKSISDFAEDFAKNHEHLDILVNNAGVLNPPFDVTEDNIESHVGINYLGHFYLTHLLTDLLIKSRAKVVVVASEAHKHGPITMEQLEGDVPAIFTAPDSDRLWNRYSVSNRARVYFAKELIVRHPELTAVSLHPGFVKTDIFRNVPTWARCTLAVFRPIMKSPEAGAATTLHCCTQDMSQHNGEYFVDSKPSVLKPGLIDPGVQVKLWDISMQMCTKTE